MKSEKSTVLFICVMGLILTQFLFAQNGLRSSRDIENVLSLREQSAILASWWQKKRETILPVLMYEQKIDLWIVTDSEQSYYLRYWHLPVNSIYKIAGLIKSDCLMVFI